MLRDHLKIDVEDRLVEQNRLNTYSRGQEDITQWAILDRSGKLKGRVELFDKLSNRRSYRVNYRITQTDLNGKIIVDRLTDAL